MEEKKRTKCKKKVKLRGLRIPKLIIYILGRKDGKNKRIKTDSDGLPKSGYLKRKNKDFVSYAARIRDVTMKTDNGTVEMIIKNKSEFIKMEKLLDQYQKEEASADDNSEDKKHKRSERRRADNTKYAMNRKKEVKQRLKVLFESHNLSAHETEQMLLDSRAKLESMVTIYLQGASKHMDITGMAENVIMNDKESEMLYKEHCMAIEKIKQWLDSKGD